MGRELRRVPMDFDWPIGDIWTGYLMMPCQDSCESCKRFAKIKGLELENHGCPVFDFLDPPKGDGYQLWETTSEGSPCSPAFATLDELCEWCESNATTFADFKASKEKWRSMLEDNSVYHREGNVTFI